MYKSAARGVFVQWSLILVSPIMPCEVDEIGFCTKCAACVEPCDHLEQNLCRRSPHLNTCFQAPVAESRTCEYDGSVKKFTMCTYNVGFTVEVGELVNFLKKERPADIVCIQEMRYWQVSDLLERLRESRWSYCGRSPRCRSIILSTFPLEEVCRFRLGLHHEFVTVRVQGFYLTCLHLDDKKEETRLHQLWKVRDQLSQKGVWGLGRMHIFAGDFNSLTKGDKSEEEWVQVAVKRERSKLEEPKYVVAESMAQKNFSDCWDQVGRQDLKITCR